MKSELHRQQRSMWRYLMLHLLLVILIPLFVTLYGGVWDVLIAFVGTAGILTLINYRYGHYLFWSLVFLLYVVKEIIVSNLIMTKLVLHPKPKLDPGIIAIPLTVTTGLEITVLAIAIAVTPGTHVIELGRREDGRNVLYVHTINVGDPDQFRATIQNGFERMILRISRGATV